MLTDKKHNFSESQALTSGATTTLASTNVVDLGPLHSSNLYSQVQVGGVSVLITVETTATSTGSATWTAKLVADNNTGMTSTALINALPSTTAVASFTAGQRFIIPIPRGVNVERYLRVDYTMGTAPFSAGGTVSATLVPNDFIADWYAFAQQTGEDNSY